jgi:hypothetical protein
MSRLTTVFRNGINLDLILIILRSLAVKLTIETSGNLYTARPTPEYYGNTRAFGRVTPIALSRHQRSHE